jgi:hypothetical protein
MRDKRHLFITGLILLIFSASCVTTKNYRDMEDQKNHLNGERNKLFAENEKLTVDNAEMKAMIESIE